MVAFSELSWSSGTAAGNMLSIYAEDATCSSNSLEYGYCVISSPEMGMTRIYLVRVTAIDKAGNVGVGECSTIVGRPSTANRPESGSDPSGDPFFLVSKLEIGGGMEPSAGTE